MLEDGPYIRGGVEQLSREASPSGALRALGYASGVLTTGPEANHVLATLRQDDAFVDAIVQNAVTRKINQDKVTRLRETTDRILARLGG